MNWRQRLQQGLCPSDSTLPRWQIWFWLGASLGFAALYSGLALRQAFDHPYIVQDDARQHIFWMARFQDPELFPNDWIANYFQSVAPIGYTWLYRMLAAMGITPFTLGKILPVILSFLTTGFCFGLALELLPIPLTGFITTLLLNQNLWMRDGYASATPRAFLYPIFVAFLYYLLRRSWLPCLLTIALQVLFYPTYGLVMAALLLLRLLNWQERQWTRDRWHYQIALSGIGLLGILLAGYALTTSQFGPTMTAQMAQTFPEFLSGGRASFFRSDPIKFWLTGSRSGLWPRSLFTPLTLLLGVSLPGLLYLRRRSPILQRVRSLVLLPQLLLAGGVLFLLAHALLFKLHLPSRYSGYTFLLALVLATGIVMTVLIDHLLRSLVSRRWGTIVGLGSTTLLAIALVGYPLTVRSFPITGYITGPAPALYQFFAQQPKDTMIASLAAEANNLPSLSQRSIWVGSEYAVPYHLGYYQRFRDRARQFIQAHYSSDLTTLKQFLHQHSIDFVLVETNAFQPDYIQNNSWIKQYQPAAGQALAQLQTKQPIALAQTRKCCSVLDFEQFQVLDARCIEKLPAIEKCTQRFQKVAQRTDGIFR